MVKAAGTEIATRASQRTIEQAGPVELGTNYTHANPPLFDIHCSLFLLPFPYPATMNDYIVIGTPA